MILKKALETMESAAIKAGDMLCNMQPQTRRLASRKDFLTDADLRADNIILQTLKDAYPNIPSFSEESGSKDLRDGYLWVIDPLDGTINFFLGDDHWAVSIALTRDERTVAAVVYLPAKRQLFSASTNAPAIFRSDNQHAYSVRDDPVLAESQIWIEWGKEEHGGSDHKKVCEIIAKVDKKTIYPQIRNSAATSMIMVACGKIAGCICPKPEPFDIAAAGLIVERAGGMVTDMDGNPWHPFSKSIVATNGFIHDELLDIIQQN